MRKEIEITAKIRSFIGGNQRKATLTTCGNGQTMNTASFWDEGSRNEFLVVNMDTGASFVPRKGIYPTFQAEHTLQPGEIMIQTGVFLGKPARPYIRFQPRDGAEKVMAFLDNPKVYKDLIF